MKEFPTNKINETSSTPEKEQQEVSPSPEKQREEIAVVFEKILEGKEYKTLKETIDERGLVIWEIEVVTEEGTAEYSYIKKGEPVEGQICDTKITVYLFDEDGLPTGGEDVAILEVGGWKRLESEIPEGLIAEEAEVVKENPEKEVIECEPYVEKIEGDFTVLLHENFLKELNSITTEQEAETSERRKTYKEALSSVLKKLHFLRDETNITEEKYESLHNKYKIASRAVGVISGKKGHGIVDHER